MDRRTTAGPGPGRRGRAARGTGGLRSALPSDIRRRNRQTVLKSLYPDRWLSRADLAKLTGLSKVSVSDVVADLIDDGLLVEGGYKSSSKPGKPAVLVGINVKGSAVMALDLSEAGLVRGIVTDLAGHVTATEEEPISPGTLQPTVLVKLSRRLLELSPVPVLGLGVATPGTVDRGGRVLAAPNLGWTDMDLAALLHGQLGVAVTVSNDADAAVFGERCFAGGTDNMILVAIARGVGAGVLIADHIVRGSDYVAGEIGHVVVDQDGPACVCGKRGCLETLIAAPVLEKRIAERPENRDDILTQAGEVLGVALSMPVALTNIKDLTISGPSDLVGTIMLEAVENTINDRVHSRFINRVDVHPARLGRQAAALGAVACVLRHELGVL